MKQISSIEEFYKVIETQQQVIIYFYTKWCPDCYMIKPFIPQLETEYPQYTFYSFDRDDSIELAKHLEIFGIPSFVIFKDGDEHSRLVNKYRKTYYEVKQYIEESIK